MRRLNLILTIFIVVLTSGLSAQAQSGCADVVLPPQARLQVNKKLFEWRIKLLSDLEAYDKELWLKEHPKECPGIAVGHFEDLSQMAYGLLLIPKSTAGIGCKIVVLAKSEAEDSYSLRILDQESGDDSGLVISKVPPGRYTGFDTTQAVRLNLDGLEAEWLEKSSVLYFWRNGKYQTLATSD
jgi:hypothetical protein